MGAVVSRGNKVQDADLQKPTHVRPAAPPDSPPRPPELTVERGGSNSILPASPTKRRNSLGGLFFGLTTTDLHPADVGVPFEPALICSRFDAALPQDAAQGAWRAEPKPPLSRCARFAAGLRLQAGP